MSKLVYLDSNDFSDLSLSDDQIKPGDRILLEQLRAKKASGRATFYISAVHLSEAVHAAEIYKDAAVRRAHLMRELAGTNMLRFPTEIMRLEIERALLNSDPSKLTESELKSAPDEFFGFRYDNEFLINARRDIQKEIDAGIKKLPRHERRPLKSKLSLSKTSSHKYWHELIPRGSVTSPLPFPLSLVSQKVAVEWFLGERSDSDLSRRITTIVSDPYLLFGEIIDRTDQRNILYQSLRDQHGALDKLKLAIDQIFPVLYAQFRYGIDLDVPGKLDKILAEQNFEKKAISTFCEKDLAHLSDAEIQKIVERSPALAAYLQSLKDYVRDRIGANISAIKSGATEPVAIKSSDFGDLMHVVYAPYFNVFRCDARMGTVFRKQPMLKDKIASRRFEILGMLDA